MLSCPKIVAGVCKLPPQYGTATIIELAQKKSLLPNTPNTELKNT
jgi:hypothetical protein